MASSGIRVGWTLVGVLLALALTAAGCGGPSAAQKRKDFLADANRICDNFETLQNQVTFPTANPLDTTLSRTTRAQWGLALNQIVNYGHQEVRQLEKLKAPDDLKTGFQRMVKLKQEAFDLLAESSDAARRNRPTEIEAPAKKAQAKLGQIEKLAKTLELPKCA